MTDKNLLTAREIVVNAARDEIASRTARIAEIRPEEIRLEAELQPLYEQRRVLRLNKTAAERTITDCEKIIDGRLGYFRKSKVTVDQVRTAMAEARERVSAAVEIENKLTGEIKPLEEPFYELSGERRKLEHEIVAYQKVISSEGSISYKVAEWDTLHSSRRCMD